MESKVTKQEQYAAQKVRLKRAIAGSFFYEAIMIEYSMFEDRSTSILEHLNCRTLNKRGKPLKLSDKLNIINDNQAFQTEFIKARLTRELIESIRLWKEKRDRLVHDLMTSPLNITEEKDVALSGNELLNIFDNRIKSICRHYKTESEKKETRK